MAIVSSQVNLKSRHSTFQDGLISTIRQHCTLGTRPRCNIPADSALSRLVDDCLNANSLLMEKMEGSC